jgi:hypothetical protein
MVRADGLADRGVSSRQLQEVAAHVDDLDVRGAFEQMAKLVSAAVSGHEQA